MWARDIQNAQLGVLVPGTARTMYPGNKPSEIYVEDDTYTWPVTDWTSSPAYHWDGQEMGPAPGLGYKFTTPFTTYGDDNHFVYIKSSGGFDVNGQYYNAASDTYARFVLDDLTCVGQLTDGASKVGPGTCVFGQTSGPKQTADELIFMRDYDPEGPSTDIDINEIMVFDDISLPYNPEFSSYTITPIIPEGGSQTYNTMAGRRQKLVYVPVQYRINMKFTWSDEQAYHRLKDGIERTIQQGSPLLYIEPWPKGNYDFVNRKAYLINLDDAPEISMVDRNIWTVTISGVTQP